MNVTVTSTDKTSTKEKTQDTATSHGDGVMPAAKETEVPQIQDEMAKDLVRFFKLLSDETRLRILFCLCHTEELHVRALCDLLQLSQPAVSHHLGMLRTAGIVEPRRDGKHNFYRILPGSCQDLLSLVFDGIPNEDQKATLRDLQLNYRPLRPR